MNIQESKSRPVSQFTASKDCTKDDKLAHRLGRNAQLRSIDRELTIIDNDLYNASYVKTLKEYGIVVTKSMKSWWWAGARGVVLEKQAAEAEFNDFMTSMIEECVSEWSQQKY